MSEFATLFNATGRPTLDQGLGDPFTYTPAGGSGSTVRGIIAYEDFENSEQFDGMGALQLAEIRNVSKAEITAPAIGDVVTIDDENWAVFGIGEGSTWTLKIRKYDPREITRENARMRR